MIVQPVWAAALGAFLVIIGILACVAFLYRYTTLYGWFKTSIGRHLVSMSACVLVLLIWSLVVAAWPNIPGRIVIRIVLLAFLTAILVSRWWIFENVNREIQKEKLKGEEEEVKVDDENSNKS